MKGLRGKPPVSEFTATRISHVKNEAAVYRLSPPLERDKQRHERVIVSAAAGETQVFPVFGLPRVLATTTGTNVAAALKALGYQLVGQR